MSFFETGHNFVHSYLTEANTGPTRISNVSIINQKHLPAVMSRIVVVDTTERKRENFHKEARSNWLAIGRTKRNEQSHNDETCTLSLMR